MRQRKRIGSAVAAAAVLAGSVFASGTAATAETLDAALVVQEAAPTSVVLPTGDRVTLLPNGSKAIEPAPGREDASFITPPSPSGDLVVVPTDQVEAIENGDEDPRRYNVSELLRTGETDAAAASESELDDRPYAGLVPGTAETFAAADLQLLNVSLFDPAGEAPDGAYITWQERDGEGSGRIPIGEDGIGGTELPPGDYVIYGDYWSDATDTERGQFVFGLTTVTIGDGPVKVALDGAAADPVTVDVERDDAQYLGAIVHLRARSEHTYMGLGSHLGPLHDLFLLPEPVLPEFDFEFLYQPVLASPEGSGDPYAYNLAFHDVIGFPDDTAFVVADEDLAAVATSYRDLGTPYGADTSDTCDYGDYTGRQLGSGLCRLIPTAVPSERTVYYTADPEIIWRNVLKAGEYDVNGDIVNGVFVSRYQIFKAGETAQVLPNGGLSSGVGEFYREVWEGANYIGGEPTPVGGGNDEELIVIGARGDAVLSRDGEVIATATDMDFYWDPVWVELPEGDAGRYTLSADVTRASTASVFGTDASVRWSFDSAQLADGDDFASLPLPVVQLTSGGVEGGYAERDLCQQITLDLRWRDSEQVVHAEDMTFEVSYDDGATWKEVELDRDGNTATAELDHPGKARWVSVRMTALDDHGTEVEHTTIRSYGLR
ncbi:hypothetical protein [Glycomyces harbinensis]|uniref:Uncharacterized protein n=1 Tax=Glycomyces harbinensis TaxID=58114 RepID=A0A1G6Z2N4_9ACTN|nr:hypothetical protein [Glycomyces harbinensis]SDD96762.1 hypothetical protein SAMN05216270_11014 [Glycomyces harbinensis]